MGHAEDRSDRLLRWDSVHYPFAHRDIRRSHQRNSEKLAEAANICDKERLVTYTCRSLQTLMALWAGSASGLSLLAVLGRRESLVPRATLSYFSMPPSTPARAHTRRHRHVHAGHDIACVSSHGPLCQAPLARDRGTELEPPPLSLDDAHSLSGEVSQCWRLARCQQPRDVASSYHESMKFGRH